MPSTSTLGIMSHPRPSSRHFSCKSWGVPWFLCPKRWSCPATRCTACISRTSFCSTKASQGRVIISRSKGARMIRSMPYRRFTSPRRSSGELMNSTGFPVTTSLGGRSKVNTTGSAPSSRARCTAFSSRAPWPRCTPSKKPRAMTVWFKISHAPKKFFREVIVSPCKRLRQRNSPSRP